MIEENGKFAEFAQDEALALVKLLETETRKVMVLVVAIEGDDIGLCRSVSRGTTQRDADALLEGLDHHTASILARMEKK